MYMIYIYVIYIYILIYGIAVLSDAKLTFLGLIYVYIYMYIYIYTVSTNITKQSRHFLSVWLRNGASMKMGYPATSSDVVLICVNHVPSLFDGNPWKCIYI